MKRIAHIILITLICCSTVSAQDLDLSVGVRTQLQGLNVSNGWDSANSGFVGNRYCIYADGSLDSHFTYSLRHHLNRANTYSDLFQSTDWLYLKYSFDSGWFLLGGKVYSEYGSWEYERDPIDVYFYSDMVGMYNCFLVGVTGGKVFNDGKDKLSFQMTRSPYCAPADNGLFAYNFSWRGSHGRLSTIYSANAMQYAKNGYEYHLALGNRYSFERGLVELDIINRMLKGAYPALTDSYAVIINGEYNVSDRLRAIAKLAFDNDEYAGKDICQLGASVEYMPLGNKDVRLFAFLSRAFGNNGWFQSVIPDSTLLGAGLSWKFNLITR